MTFEQIDCFIAAVHADTFFDAAELLHTTQSTLSKQIQKLEKELNLQLFDRSRRNAVLTPAGELFYQEAQELSRQYHQMLHRMSLYQTASNYLWEPFLYSLSIILPEVSACFRKNTRRFLLLLPRWKKAN